MIVEGPAMALGLLANEHPHAAVSVLVTAAGNHAVVRGHRGMQEGEVSAERNAQGGGKQQKPRQQRRGPREPKPDWREHVFHVRVPPRSQQLLWVAVALVDQHWEFCLESISIELSPCETDTDAQGTLPEAARHPFAPRPVLPSPLASLPRYEDRLGGEEDADLELLAAIAASCSDIPGGTEAGGASFCPDGAMHTDHASDDDDLLRAIAASYEDRKLDHGNADCPDAESCYSTEALFVPSAPAAAAWEPEVAEEDTAGCVADEVEAADLALAIQLSLQGASPAPLDRCSAASLCSPTPPCELFDPTLTASAKVGGRGGGRWSRRSAIAQEYAETGPVVEKT